MTSEQEQKVAAMRARQEYFRTHSRPSADRPWFSYDPDDGFLFFATEKEARENAENLIPNHLDEGWSEEVDRICIGKISAVSTQVDLRQRPPAEELDEDGLDENGDYWDPDWDYCCNYKLMPPAAEEVSK